MHTHAPQPTARRVASFLWFPFFFAAAFSLIGLYTFHQPAPHDMRVAVTPATDARAVTNALTNVEQDGFAVEAVAGSGAAKELVETGQVAAAIDGQQVYVSSGASPLRANFLTEVMPHLLGPNTHVVDVRPTASGDMSGVSIFFYGLPLLLVGLITSIVLVQLGMWPLRRKLAAIAATGAFTSVVTYVVATGLDAVPSDPRLPLYGFLLTQTIGWLTTAAAQSLRQFFMPAAMTFVLVLGIPSSGGTVNGDMLPAGIGWLNDVLPFAQFIDATRASVYASGAGLARPLLILATWAVAGVALVGWTARRARRVAAASRPADQQHAVDPEAQAAPGFARLFGRITTLSGRPVAHSFVSVLDQSGAQLRRTATDAAGWYDIDDLPAGLHHVVVTAHHGGPEIVTVRLDPDDDRPRDLALQQRDDPAGNPSADEVVTRRQLNPVTAATGRPD